jgi:capsular polysaccharide biosynthesis protein
MRRNHAFVQQHVYRLNDAAVDLRTGLVKVDKLLLQESVGHYRNLLNTPPRLRNLFAKVPYNSDPYAYVITATPYYHFVLESLPRLLHAASQYPVQPYMFDNTVPYIDQFLAYLAAHNIVKPCKKTRFSKIGFSDLIFTQMHQNSGFVHPDDSALVRSTFLKWGDSKQQGPRRFFVSRRQGARLFDNQAAIEQELARLDLAIVYLEDFSMPDQIRLFRDADLIVANHGAGLANLIWSLQKPRVIELFSPIYLNDCYARLAQDRAREYQFMIATRESQIGWGKIEIDQLISIVK